MLLTNSRGLGCLVRELIGQQRFHSHQIQHTYAYRMLVAGISHAAVQQLLGRSTVVMTQRYAELGDDGAS